MNATTIKTSEKVTMKTSDRVVSLSNLIEDIYTCNYYGIEFERNSANNGGEYEYHKLIGNKRMLEELPLHDLIQLMVVDKNGPKQIISGTNITKDVDGNTVDLSGADGSDILQRWGGVWAICGGTNEIYDRWIIGSKPFSYDGDDAIYYPFFAESPDYSVVVDNQQRCIYDTTVAGTMGDQNTAVIEGFEDYTTAYGFPKTLISRFNYELYARNKNDDNTQNFPYCNINTVDDPIKLAMMYIECRTKLLTNVLGCGISSNVIPNDSNWGTVSGAKFIAPDGTISYKTLGSATIYIDGSTSGITIQQVVTGDYYPMTTIFEAQRDIANGCVVGTFENAANCADGTPIRGLDDGIMTGIWTKTMIGKINCSLTDGGTPEEYTVEIVLRLPLYRGGRVKEGDLWWWKSGSEVLLYIDDDGTRHNILYQALKIKDIMTDTDTTNKTTETDWEFTKYYERIGEVGSTNKYCKQLLRTSKGVTMLIGYPEDGATYESFEAARLSFDTSSSTVNNYIRRGVLVGGRSLDSNCVVRYAHAYNSPSTTHVPCGGGFRRTLDEEAENR